MRVLFTLTLFLSSFLLFLIEPMVAKMILPTFGGAPAVWSASLVFFQAFLLLGYGYAHLSTRRMGVRRQSALHIALMAVAAVTLPFSTASGGFATIRDMATNERGQPALLVLMALTLLVGLPFFVVSAGSSLLQRWFATTGDPAARDPYFLYAASNLGSMLALLAYPFGVEPALRLQDQSRIWTFGYAALVLAMAVCAFALRRGKPAATAEADEATEEPRPEPTTKQRLRWTLLAAVPSSLLLGVTTYVTTNIAPIPLLWVVPLALYLLTFIFAFSNRKLLPTGVLGRLLPILVTPLALVVILESAQPLLPLACLHLAVFFVAAWMCHGLLHDERPDAAHLTEFYFWIALGGVIGGAFNGLLAPAIFHSLAEYPIALVLACLVRPAIVSRRAGAPGSVRGFWNRKDLDWAYPLATLIVTIALVLIVKGQNVQGPPRTFFMLGVPAILCFLAIDRPIRFGLALGAVFLVSSTLHSNSEGVVALSERSFFGVHRVVLLENGRMHRLVHGNTIHGLQDMTHPDTPLTYYYPTSPIGQVFKYFSGARAKHDVALVGLGIGSLAAYGEPGQNMTYFEIDPVVRAIATDTRYFTFISRSKANVKIVLGDGRLTLAKQPEGKFGLVVLDAFSSDAIPIHMLTKEAVQMYLRKLQPDGVLAFHISNHYLGLEPVLAAIAKDLKLQAIDQQYGPLPSEASAGATQSEWVVMSRHENDISGLLGQGSDWSQADPDPHVPEWTDDFSNVLSVFRQED